MTATTVTITVDRLKALEELEAALPSLIAKAKEEAVVEVKKVALTKLHEKQKADPKAHSSAVLKKYHENKEEINAKRRAAYQAKKAAAATIQLTP
jgi:hypothetical protein